MRITNSMLSDMFLKDMNTNLENLSIIQKQRTSGKKFSKPSDDPSNVVRAMQLHSDININKQYNKNINNVINYLDVTDEALDQLGNQLGKIRDQLVAVGNAGYVDDQREAIKHQVNEIIGSMAQTLNTSFDGKYVFAGSRVSSKPVKADINTKSENTELIIIDKTGAEISAGTEYEQLKSDLKVEISEGVVLKYNVTSTEVIKFEDRLKKPRDLKEILQSIVNHLDGNDDKGNAPTGTDEEKNKIKRENVIKLDNEDLAAIDEAISNVLKIRSQTGAKQNRMEDSKKMNEEANFNMKEILSHTEDIDVVEKSMEFSMLQAVYVSSLQTSARVIQPTLMDYLK